MKFLITPTGTIFAAGGMSSTITLPTKQGEKTIKRLARSEDSRANVFKQKHVKDNKERHTKNKIKGQEVLNER